MTIRRAPILQSLASRLSAAAFVAALVAAPSVPATEPGLGIPESAGLSILGVFDGKDVAQRAAAMWIIFFYPTSQPSANSNRPHAKAAPNYGSISPVQVSARADYCIGSSGVALDPSGKHVYMSGGFGLPGRMCGFVIDPVTQAWTPVTTPGATPVAVGSNPRVVAIEPSGRFVYVAGDLDGTISGFAIDQVTGVPTPLPGSPFATGGSLPIPVVIDRSGRFMYVGQSVGSFDGSIAVFAIDATTGALSHIPGSPFPNVANFGRIAALALSPDGRFLFTGGSALATYSVNPVTGVPTRIAWRAGYYYGLAVDPTGRFIFGVDDTDDLLRGFSIAADGALAPAGVTPDYRHGNAGYHRHRERRRPDLRRQCGSRRYIRLPHQSSFGRSHAGGRVAVCIAATAERLCRQCKPATVH